MTLHIGKRVLARPTTKALPDVAIKRMAGLVTACTGVYPVYMIAISAVFPRTDVQVTPLISLQECKVLKEQQLVILHISGNDLIRPTTKALPDVAIKRMDILVTACKGVYPDSIIAFLQFLPRIDV